MRAHFAFGIALLTSLFPLSRAMANDYQITISSQTIADLNYVKNCVDYHFCTAATTSLVTLDHGYRFHTFVKVGNFEDLNYALNECNLPGLGINASVFDQTLNKEIPISSPVTSIERTFESLVAPTIKDLYRNIYVPKFTSAEILTHYNTANTLLKEKKYSEAIQFILVTFKTNTYGYTVQPSTTIGAEYCTTDHSTKKVQIGSYFLKDACDLMQAIRHEFEHVFQINQVNECKALGKIHGLDDHQYRERSAYLDDYENIPEFCPSPAKIKELRDNALYQFNTKYKN